jgi:glycosyltransferase involved in cell wall biosynthesis
MKPYRSICFYINYLNQVPGGAERVLCDIASGLATRGYDITIISDDPSPGMPFFPLSSLVKRLYLNTNPHHPLYLRYIQRIIRLRCLLREIQPSVAIGFMHTAYMPLGLASWGTGIPAVGSEHIVMDHYQDRPFERWVLFIAGLFLRRTTVLSDKIKDAYPWLLRRHMVPITNPITLSRGPGLHIERQPIMLGVGRFTLQKDFQTLITAFGQVAPDFPNWSLHIYGSGELRQDLQQTVEKSPVKDRIQLLDPVPDLSPIYARASLFVLSSRYESFGLVTAEAMMHGLPVLGFADCPGTNDLVQSDVNGLLVSGPDRVQALADGMRDLITNPDRRQALGRNGPRVQDGHRLADVLDRWENMIRDVSS